MNRTGATTENHQQAGCITRSPAWKALLKHRDTVKDRHLREWFQADPERSAKLSFQVEGLRVDFSRQRLGLDTFRLLQNLAQTAEVAGFRDRMFSGARINSSEDRRVLHPALRYLKPGAFPSSSLDVMPEIREVRARMRSFSEQVRSGQWRGFSGDAIRDVVNIGIGGSALGPKLVVHALAASRHPELRFHFVSNPDSASLAPLLDSLDPRTTLFVLASKSFTTRETMLNATSACDWLCAAFNGRRESVLSRHCIAVTACPEYARALGLGDANIFRIWDWVGGRYSLWSAVGITIALAVGMERFEQLLSGAQEMDQHFMQASLAENLPVLMALVDIWNTNFLGAQTSAVLPYCELLRFLPAFLQQLEMESNGKSVGTLGQCLDYRTSPVIWGEIGPEGQHAFFQLLHQGSWLVPCEIIASAQSDFPLSGHQEPLLANCFAQATALAFGRTASEVRIDLESAGYADDDIAWLLPHKVLPGNQPSTMVLLPQLDPYHLGLLLALYEHKTFTQGVIWGINPFDQWGVEFGKQIAERLLPALRGEVELDGFDQSTAEYIRWYRRYGVS